MIKFHAQDLKSLKSNIVFKQHAEQLFVYIPSPLHLIKNVSPPRSEQTAKVNDINTYCQNLTDMEFHSSHMYILKDTRIFAITHTTSMEILIKKIYCF